MSFSSYPIITQGSNIDILRQGHNLLTTNVGDMNGLQTSARDTLVDAINSLNSSFSALVVSAYPPLNNEQWLTAKIQSGFGTLNLFKLSNTNEFVIGQHMIPLSTLTDLGKLGTAWRVGYITTVNTAKVQAAANTNLELASSSVLTFSLANSNLILNEDSPTALTLLTAGESLFIRSTNTRLYSTTNFWDLTAAGHWEPGANQAQNVGSPTKQVNNVYTKNITASGDVTFNADVVAPNAGLAVPIGGGCLWFLPTPPQNYIIADGTPASRSQYPALHALYAAAGYPYGAGNGSTTFGIPNMKGRGAFGVDTSVTAPTDISAPGKTFGTLNHSHNVVVPRHYHGPSGLTISDHINQITGGPSQLPSASFSGDELPGHDHSISQSDHGHGISQSPHGHSMHDPGHIHGAGLPVHKHFCDTAGRSGGNSRDDPGTWFNGSNGSPQIPLFTNLGVDFNIETFGSSTPIGIGIDAASVVFQGLSINANNANISVNGGQANITVLGRTAGKPTGSVTLSGTSHTHTIPTLTHSVGGTVGNITGFNGDQDQQFISNTANPPFFCVHFIIRAK